MYLEQWFHCIFLQVKLVFRALVSLHFIHPWTTSISWVLKMHWKYMGKKHNEMLCFLQSIYLQCMSKNQDSQILELFWSDENWKFATLARVASSSQLISQLLQSVCWRVLLRTEYTFNLFWFLLFRRFSRKTILQSQINHRVISVKSKSKRKILQKILVATSFMSQFSFLSTRHQDL